MAPSEIDTAMTLFFPAVGQGTVDYCVMRPCAAWTAPAFRETWPRLVGRPLGSPKTPALGESGLLRCPTQDSAWPIPPPLPLTSPESSSSRRAPPSLR